VLHVAEDAVYLMRRLHPVGSESIPKIVLVVSHPPSENSRPKHGTLA
jgi:hypothetical protein